MVSKKLEGLKDHIWKYNKYFNNAFDDAMKTPRGIEATVAGKRRVIFPDDTLGDYFYLRMSDRFTFGYDKMFNVSTAQNNADMRSDVSLIACVKDADEDKLLEYLINTVRTYQREYVRFGSCVVRPEFVVLQELAGLGEEVVDASIQRIKPNYSIVSVSFQYSFPILFTNPKCYDKPCKTC